MDKLNLALSLSVQYSQLRRYWDKKLSQSVDNPFPLAPRDLVRMGLVNFKNYTSENHKFSMFCDSMMQSELSALSTQVGFGPTVCPEIKILGIGLMRGLGWMRYALDLGFYIKGYDVSQVACDLLSRQTRDLSNGHQIEVVEGEAESELKNSEQVDNHETLIYYLSQFIQVQKKTKMKRIMRRLGHLLKTGPSGLVRSVCLIHPFGRDNIVPSEWETYTQSVEWGDTTPYSLGELVGAMGKDCVSEASILGIHRYFHQTYSFVRIRGK